MASRLIGVLLFAALCAIDLAIVGEIQIRKNEWPGAGGVIGIGLAFAQISLLSVWAVWGSVNVIVRAVVTLLGCFAIAFLASYSTDGHGRETNEWFGILLLYSGMTAFPFVIARFNGVTLRAVDSLAMKGDHRRLGSNQYTIWGLLSLMTAVGIACTVMRFIDFPKHEVVEASIFFALLTVVACSNIFLLLRSPIVWIPVLLAAITYPCAGLILNLVDFAPNDHRVELVVAICVQGTTTVAAGLVLRAGGLRLDRGSRSATVPQS